MVFLITGGCGFIGSNFIHQNSQSEHVVVNIDKLAYSSNILSLDDVSKQVNYLFYRIDICDADSLKLLFDKHHPSIVFNFAAESHVDRSIDYPMDFIQTNVVGAFTLLNAAKIYYESLSEDMRKVFKFIQVSTDEVYGSLPLNEGQNFNEDSPYRPNSPYSATKASADHLARAYYKTYGLPTIVTNCSNNYGPYQFPEKLIPMMIESALAEKELPIYGNGQNVRDWLYVEDHCRALLAVAMRGRAGETYNIGGRCERSNIEVVRLICDIMDELRPRKNGRSYRELIAFVKDRPGHDLRYAIDCSKIEKELGWRPEMPFDQGMRQTVKWYLDNREWVQSIYDGSYRLKRQGVIP